jgi:hypothetical protein
MKKRIACAAMVAALMPTGAAFAGVNTITVGDPADTYNVLMLEVGGSDNVLSINQSAPIGASGPNSMTVTIDGDFNGGTAGSFGSVTLLSGLTPGVLSQAGQGNRMTLGVTGSHNLFAMVQSGSYNVIGASISGTGNQAAVTQAGIGNHLSFSQSGTGNIIQVSQTSW